MYPDEIYKYLEERNYELTGQEILEIIDVVKNSQLNHIKFNCYDNTYEMWDYMGNYYRFKAKVIPENELEKSGSVRKK